MHLTKGKGSTNVFEIPCQCPRTDLLVQSSLVGWLTRVGFSIEATQCRRGLDRRVCLGTPNCDTAHPISLPGLGRAGHTLIFQLSGVVQRLSRADPPALLARLLDCLPAITSLWLYPSASPKRRRRTWRLLRS